MSETVTSLKVKCPYCKGFLKDDTVKLDGLSSIKMIVEAGGKKGHFWISSVYGSNLYKTDIKIMATETARFYCPLCNHTLNTHVHCSRCGAEMASIYLSNGGIVNFCTRQGCNNNYIEFPVDTERQEEKLPSRKSKSLLKILGFKSFKEKEKISENTDTTFLHSYCPHCFKGLSDKLSTSVKIMNMHDEMGFIVLSPFLNNEAIKCTLNIPPGEKVKDMLCPYCNKSLINPEKKCQSCGSEVAELLVPGDSRLIHYQICTRRGCLCHGLSENDIRDIRSMGFTLAKAIQSTS